MTIREAWLPLFFLAAACGGSSTGRTGGGGKATTSSTSAGDAGAQGGAEGGAQGGAAGSGGKMGSGGAFGACTDCGGACVDLANDAANCGKCGHTCPAQQHCDHGVCAPPACLVQGPICPGDHLCCGNECCPAWKTCCNVPGGGPPTCVWLDAGACPSTCATCP